MKKNFDIKDAVLFSFSGDQIDLRGDCELESVSFFPSNNPIVEIKWNIENTNHKLNVKFISVEDFIVRSRDESYPPECGTMLAIAGFSDGISCGSDDEFCIEPSQGMNYMSFVMDDQSAFLIKAGSAIMRRV